MNTIDLFIRQRPRSVSAFLNQWLVVFATWPSVNGGPARFAVVLQTGHVGAKEGRELAATSRPGALIAHLVVQDVGFHFNLATKEFNFFLNLIFTT